MENIQRHQVATESRLDRLGDVYGDCSSLKADTSAKNDTCCDNHAVVYGASFKSATDCVQDARDDDGPAATEVFVAGRDENGASNGCDTLVKGQ